MDLRSRDARSWYEKKYPLLFGKRFHEIINPFIREVLKWSNFLYSSLGDHFSLVLVSVTI